MKTQDIHDLVREVINSIPEPFPHDIIDKVCSTIEHDTYWLNRYKQLVSSHGKEVTNQWIGRYVKRMSGFNRNGPLKKAKSGLIKVYTWLS